MIDFISATKCLYKDSPNLSNCKWISRNAKGEELYELMGQKPMKVIWKPSDGLFTIKGSIPYFLQGHNFSFDTNGFIECVNFLQSLLDVGLWDAWLNEFEHGVIFPVEGNPSDYIRYHSTSRRSKLKECTNGKDNGNGKWWVGSASNLKLYNPKSNFKGKVSKSKRMEIESYDPKQNYLKFEVHYNQPHLLNAGRNLLVEDLQSPHWQTHLGEILLDQYKLLQPMRTLVKPTEKSITRYQELITMQLVEVLMNQGKTIPEIQKDVYRFMDEFNCLSKANKDKRKATARKVFGMLRESETSQWDLTANIEEALQNEM